MSVILRVGAVKPNRGQESHYGSGDEASSSYTDADVLDIQLPEHTYQRPSPPTSSFTHNSTGYFGLPYQDHNYGMPPPPSPPRPASPRPPSPLQVNGVVQMEEEVNTTPLVCVEEEVVEDSVTRCICGYLHDDGYMICCDKCSVWQHIDCMGVDRNNIPESYFCEVCQPRILDAAKAKSLQKRKREELAARNVLSDSSATDTDPEEAANALASMGRKLPASKKKGFRQKRTKVKDKPPLKLKISKTLSQKKPKKSGKKEKENIKNNKPKKLFKSGSQKLKSGKMKNRPLLTLEQLSGDPWNSSLSPWVDSYEYADENQYSPAVREFSCNSHLIGQSVDISSIMPDQLLAQLTSVADVKKNRKGLRTTQEIPAGQAIIEYKGKVMLRHDYDKEHAFVNSFKRLQPFVLFYSKLDVDLCVDARIYGNEARFVRRSCTPNSEVQHIFSQGKIYFVVVSQKDIQAGAEITIPFDYNYQDCSYCVECACIKNNCVVSRYWKKMKNAHKSSVKDFTAKQRKQSGGDGAKATLNDGSNSSSSQTSPSKASSSPVKALQIKLAAGASPPPLTSPIKLSNVSTLLAASALLDGQPDLADTFQLDVSETLQQTPPTPVPPPPPAKSATSSRRGSRISDDSVKEEKPQVGPVTNVKDKHKKQKEVGPKLKDKESKDHQYHNTEIKKEKRPSSRRQSQDDSQDSTDLKSEPATPVPAPISESEDSNTAVENRKKMTREERKLDAIMKAFEKMEKREERRKEAMSRGSEPSTKKCAENTKPKKKEDADSSGGTCNSVQSSSTSQEVRTGEEVMKVEPSSVDDQQQPAKSPAAGGETKLEISVPESSTTSLATDSTNPPSAVSSVSSFIDAVRPLKEESPQKPLRKSGKRKRRRSRVQSATALSDAASVSTDEGNSNSSFPPAPLSVPVTPSATPLNTPMPPSDVDGGMFKYIKIKKHLFEEWSQKQEDDSSRQEEEMFVQCLPNPHVNTMDHLQRRNSHSAGCKGPESSAGSAKKRWLRQAMHDVPAPVAFNHSLSVSTDSGSASPVYGGASPNPGTGLGSPGAASPLDFVTPLKKRRLMRESVSSESNGPITSPGPGVLAENFTSNSVGVTPKPNGVKQFLPAHRHSTDDRLLLHKGYPHPNGLRDTLNLNGGKRSVTGTLSSPATTQINLDHHLGVKEVEMCSRSPDLPVEPVTASAIAIPSIPLPLPHVNGISEAVPISSVPFTQPRTKFPVKLRGIFERMEVDSTGESSKEREIQATASSSRIVENGVSSFRSPLPSLMERPSSKFEDSNGIDSSASTSTVVVVNSSGVYSTSGVNTLMDEGSEAGCVTAKSIMDVDSPAIVRVDLNAHEMEPSSLSDSSAVVNLTDSFFRGSILSKRFDTPSECQVNSSEDVEAMPLVTEGHNSDICDNTCTDSSSAQVCRVGEREGESTVNRVEEEGEAVDSSQRENIVSDEFVAATGEEQVAGNSASGRSIFRHPSTSKLDMEFISSSGQPSSNNTDLALVEHSSVCDSVEEATEGVQSADSRPCDSGSVTLGGNRVSEVSERSTGCEEIRTCDSVEGNLASTQSSTNRALESSSSTEVVGDGAVTESHCTDGAAFFVNSIDNNVDSTSCETSKSLTHKLPSVVSVDLASDAVGNVDSCCDSNFERQPTAGSVFENSLFGDESSLEGQGVSSSNVTDLQVSNNSWDSDVRRDIVSSEAVPDNAVSAHNPEYNSGISQSSSANLGLSSISTATQEQPDLNMESQPSSSAVSRPSLFPPSNSTVQSSSQIHTSHPPSSPLSVSTSPLPSSSTSSISSAASVDGVLSSTSPGAYVVQPGTALDISSVPVTCSPPTSSTGEATPAVKKKVSLLEYRKRLKEKPTPSCAETKTSVAAESSPSSSSSSTTHHHKLSSTLSLYLSSSSPTASSSTSTSPAKSPSSSSISPRSKHKMPTLATLPLFKSSDPSKDEKKRHKPRPEKQLSLTERLRLEFGLDDCEEDASKKKKDARMQHRGRTTPPPPPPLHPPPLLPHGASPHHHHHPVTRHNVADEESEVASSNGGVDDSVPPPPPPTTASGSGYLSPAVASGFVASSTHPRTGFHGSPAPLVNGGPGSGYNYHQQQPSISSTSLSTPQPLSSHTPGGRERHGSGFSGHNGTPGSLPSHPVVAPYQQQPSSSSLSTSPHHIPPHAQAPHQHSWAANQGPHPSTVASVPQPSTNPQHPPPLQYDYNHRQPSQTHTAVSGNILSEDHPPPPPPPPPRSHHRPSSSSSSSSHRHNHHHHQSSSRKSKSSKAAASSSTSSRYSDNRSRY